MMAEGDGLGRLQMVKPGITVSACSSARARKTEISAVSAASTFTSSSLTQRRKSSATWSLRERAVWQALGGKTDLVGEPRLDIHVNVFKFA